MFDLQLHWICNRLQMNQQLILVEQMETERERERERGYSLGQGSSTVLSKEAVTLRCLHRVPSIFGYRLEGTSYSSATRKLILFETFRGS